MPECLNLTNLNCLGDQDASQIVQGDILSALAFDTTGKFLSVGDYEGRCIIFSEALEKSRHKTFDFFMEFNAYDQAIDYYSNQKVPEMISAILWLTQPTSKSLLTCNAKQVKLWNIKEKQPQIYNSSQKTLLAKNRLIIPKSRP